MIPMTEIVDGSRSPGCTSGASPSSPPLVLRGRVRVGVSHADRRSTPTPTLPLSTRGGGNSPQQVSRTRASGASSAGFGIKLPLTILIAALSLAISSSLARADEAATIRRMYDLVKPSLVAVKYTWASELGSRELTAAGVVVSDDGLVAFPIGIVTPMLVPDDQMQKFKIVVPSDTTDETEIDATFQGRDERTGLAFVRPDSPRKWKPVQFVDSPPQTGETLYSVGMLPKGAGYKATVTTAIMSTRLADR